MSRKTIGCMLVLIFATAAFVFDFLREARTSMAERAAWAAERAQSAKRVAELLTKEFAESSEFIGDPSGRSMGGGWMFLGVAFEEDGTRPVVRVSVPGPFGASFSDDGELFNQMHGLASPKTILGRTVCPNQEGPIWKELKFPDMTIIVEAMNQETGANVARVDCKSVSAWLPHFPPWRPAIPPPTP